MSGLFEGFLKKILYGIVNFQSLDDNPEGLVNTLLVFFFFVFLDGFFFFNYMDKIINMSEMHPWDLIGIVESK